MHAPVYIVLSAARLDNAEAISSGNDDGTAFMFGERPIHSKYLQQGVRTTFVGLFGSFRVIPQGLPRC